MSTRPLGSAIGATGGLCFVLASAGGVPASPAWVVGAVLAFVVISWFVVLRGPAVDVARPGREAIRTYLISVAVMVVAIPVGASVITLVLDEPEAVLVWVVLVVGAHFWPFARAFGLPAFRWLAASLVAVSAAGALTSSAYGGAAAAGWTGVVAGVVLLTFSAVGPRLAPAAPTPP